jgi:regulator of RNase E activity RraA
MVQVGGIQVRPGDWIIGDGSGVVVIPQEHLEEVVRASEAIVDREQKMAEMVRRGKSILEAMGEGGYERMLERQS